ncbi:Sec1-like protein [Phascolomyces articulosus]|uniref:Sec1-like protein n=1 Tax=Phascolomyces articulosus TaxID=60185 RepID=A0AAD5K4W7_9FUNG|nr:Sec1-like protein [Phascolomyces articulosus]
MYAAAHVFFIQGLDISLLKDLSRRLKEAKVQDLVKSLKDMYMDFIVREPAVFTLDDPQKFYTLFSNQDSSEDWTSSASKIGGDLDDIAKQLLCVCVSLALQSQLDEFCKNTNFPPPKDPPMQRGTIIILDRTIDPVSPLLHEFTYQAMVADLLNVEETPSGLKYSYEYTQEDGTTKDQETLLTDQDTVYTSIRHMHIAITTEQLIDDFNKFMSENEGGSGHTSVKSLNDMKNMIANLPQFQEMKTKFSAHMTIASDCMTEFREQTLEAIGLLEQNMACGETPDKTVPKHLVDDLLPILDDPYTTPTIKARLIMLWFATCDKVDPEQLELLLAHARLDKQHKDAIDNMSYLGVQLSKSASKQGEKSSRWHRKKRESVAATPQDDVPFDLSRYVPVVKRVAEGHIKETIDQSLFPFLRVARPEDLRRDSSHSPKEGLQLRVYKTQWHKKSITKNAGPKPASGPPVIIFIAGGMTYSEMRSAYELAQTHDRDVYIGSTHIITPDGFVEALSDLTKAPPAPEPVVPRYTSNIHHLAPNATRTAPASPVPSRSSKNSKK